MTSKKRKVQKLKHDPFIPQPNGKKRLWVFRLTAMIAVPLILFAGLELGLRLGGVGYSTEIATKQTVNGSDRYCYNLKLGWRFFPKKIARDLAGFAFDSRKTPETYRIFVLGASAAQGIPDESYNFGRFLEIMLENEYPHTDFEVINAAMTAINSHAVYQIAKSCGRFEPDLMIVYLGNNEVVGPYGAGTVFAPLSPSLGMIRANFSISSMKTGQLVQSLSAAVGPGGNVPQSWGGMEMFLDEQVRPESEALTVVYSHFEQNLRDICKVGIKAGAKVIVSNVGCNLKDSPPFASLHRDGLTDSEKRAWEEVYREGVVHEAAGELQAALGSYLAAEQIDGTFADLQFRLGRCYWNLGDYAKAKERYIRARECDTLRFRADTTINQIIRSIAEGQEQDGVYFADTVKALEENSPHGTPGKELFYEHVHYRFEGNYILAKSVFDQVQKILPEKIRQHGQGLPPLTLADCENRLVYTPFERYQNAQFVLKRLINKPPFTNQSYHNELATQLVSEVDALWKEIQPDREKILSMYNERITQHPHDWRLRWKLADLYYQDPATYEQAAVQLNKILVDLPYHKAYEGLVKILIRQNKLDEAERYCQDMIEMKPLSAGTYSDLGNIFRKKGAYDKAIKNLSRAIELQPTESIHAYGYLADVFVKKGNPEKAINTLYEAIDHSPKELTAMAHVNLGLLLGRQKRTEEAIRILRTAIETFPPEEIKKENDVFELLLQLDQIELALELYRQILTVKPDSIAILNNLAWIQATRDDETIRNPKEAVEYAERACTLTGYKSPGTLDTLAAAYASAGDFERAVMTAQKAATLATQEGNPALTEIIESHLRLYQSGKMLLETGR